MFGEEKNLKTLKDTNLPLPSLPLTKGEEQGGGMSYTKTNKLITALYMVTDIIDKDEPLRNKLRTLGTGIISDTHSSLLSTCDKISETMSFLDIASAMNIISEMNCNILRKEFLALDQSIKETNGKTGTIIRQVNLTEFFRGEDSDPYPASPLLRGRSKEGVFFPSRGREISKGHISIGVQKGSTLLKAIKDMSNKRTKETSTENFDILKKQRREDIISIIKTVGGNATIKDIRDKAQGTLVSCSEKTLQRELISMVKDDVLKKAGEKRWSRYFLK